MSWKIYKYAILNEYMPGTSQTLKLPAKANILDVQYQRGKLMLWAVVNPEEPLINHNIYIYGTGHELDVLSQDLIYLKTVQEADGAFIWHIFIEKHLAFTVVK